MPKSDRYRKLQWLCRRGMKELDVLLDRFLRAEREELASGGWPDFESLLEQEDDILWDWLMNPSLEGAAGYRELLERIRGRSR